MDVEKKSKNGSAATRDGFAQALLSLGKSHPQVLALTADLGGSVGMTEFAKTYPQRFLEIGIAEQNMAGIAAGLALNDWIPYMGSFAAFQPMRNLDQIRTSICIMNANVKIVSSHAGFSYAGDGIQIQTLEDLAVMRTLPNMQVLVPADAMQAKEFALQMADFIGPQYLRLGRAPMPYLETYPGVDADLFAAAEIGRAQMLRGGSDAMIVSCGVMVFAALDAAVQLAEQGIHVGVLNMHTIKPLDEAAVVEMAERVGRIVVAEEHQRFGGLGSAVAEVLATSGLRAQMAQVAVDDQFGETSRDNADLYRTRGLESKDIVAAVRQLLG